MTQEERDYKSYKTYVDLWVSENTIKTIKLQVLLAINGLLVATLQIAGGPVPKNWLLFLTGALLSFIWVLSIGRTSLFQKAWQIKANEISSQPEYANDPRFQILKTQEALKKAPPWLQILGCVPSKYYLLGAPILFSLLWSISLLYVLLTP